MAIEIDRDPKLRPRASGIIVNGDIMTKPNTNVKVPLGEYDAEGKYLGGAGVVNFTVGEFMAELGITPDALIAFIDKKWQDQLDAIEAAKLRAEEAERLRLEEEAAKAEQEAALLQEAEETITTGEESPLQ